jgi:hypothetical protein
MEFNFLRGLFLETFITAPQKYGFPYYLSLSKGSSRCWVSAGNRITVESDLPEMPPLGYGRG